MPHNQELLAHDQTSSVASSAGPPDCHSSALLPARRQPTVGQQPAEELGPAILAVLGRIAVALEQLSRLRTGNGLHANDHPGEFTAPVGSTPSDGSPRPTVPTIAVPTEARSQDVHPDRLADLEAGVAEIRQLLKAQAGQTVKQLYTVNEVAERTGFSPWTLRHACNKGRIKAQKGPDGQWRVPHDELVKIQNQGLPK